MGKRKKAGVEKKKVRDEIDEKICRLVDLLVIQVRTLNDLGRLVRKIDKKNRLKQTKSEEKKTDDRI